MTQMINAAARIKKASISYLEDVVIIFFLISTVDKLVIWQSHKQELVELVESVHDEVEDDQYRQCFIRYLQHKGLIAQGSHTYSAIIDELDQKIVADPEHLVELQKVLEQDMHLYTVGLKMRYQLEDITLDKLRKIISTLITIFIKTGLLLHNYENPNSLMHG